MIKKYFFKVDKNHIVYYKKKTKSIESTTIQIQTIQVPTTQSL